MNLLKQNTKKVIQAQLGRYSFISLNQSNEYRLVFVQLLIRHGHRYCMRGQHLKGHPYYEEQLNYKGHLTPVGMIQQQRLGSVIRQEYILQKKLVDIKYDINKLSAYSSNSSRCLQSAQSFMQGLFPQQKILSTNLQVEDSIINPPYNKIENTNEGNKQNHDRDQLDYPFPIRNFGVDDYLLNPSIPNKKLITTEQKQQSSERVKNEIKYFEKDLILIKQKIGLEESFNHLDASSLFDIAQSQRYFGITYDLNEFDYRLLNYLKAVSKLNSQYTPSYSKITISPLLHSMLKFLESKIDNQLGFNMMLGFTHDSRIVPLMQLFNLMSLEKQREDLLNNTHTTECYPAYCSNFIVELYESNKSEQSNSTLDRYKVGVKYNGDYLTIPKQRTPLVRFTDFQEFIQSQLVSDQEYNTFTGSQLSTDYFINSIISSKKQ